MSPRLVTMLDVVRLMKGDLALDSLFESGSQIEA